MAILVYNSKQICELENIATKEYKISTNILMYRAGRAVFDELKRTWPYAFRITVVCGGGNNAGDGYVVASLAKQAKLDVSIFQLSPYESLKGVAKKAANKCKKLKIKSEKFTVEKFKKTKTDVIVDAIFGVGLKADIKRESFLSAIDSINSSKIPVISVDLPSGIDADTGRVCGAAVVANVSVTFIGHKLGLYIGQARDYCGKVICNDLGLNKKLFNNIDPCAKVLNVNDLDEKLRVLQPRKLVSNKGDFGRVLVVGGDYSFGGAVYMAAAASARVGAGLVSVATRPDNVFAINAARPEIIVHGIRKKEEFIPILKQADIVIIGPGLGKSVWGKMLLVAALKSRKPMVIDADALNIIATGNIGRIHENCIFTPHPGEAARLLNLLVSDIQADRFSSVNKLQQILKGVCVLKGSGTLIANQDGIITICDSGNPGMASGGMGDILSGIIGGVLAQGVGLGDAAILGVLVHAVAGDLAAFEHGKRGMLALDLLPYIKKIINSTKCSFLSLSG